MSRVTLLLLLAAPAALLMACGSDSTSGTTSTGGGGGSPTGTSTSGAGGATSAATGTGGDASTTTAGSTSTSTTTGATGSTGTGMMMGACTNPTDLDIISMKDVKKVAEGCGKSNLGAEPATKNCSKMGTGLSDGCVTCFDDIVQCVVKNCFNECFADPGSAACSMCREAKCNPAFAMCSGLPAN